MTWVALLAVVASGACGGAPSSDPPPAKHDAGTPTVSSRHYTTTQQVVHLDEPKLDLPKQESFKLIDAGAGDKAPLRYQLAGGSTLHVESKLSSRHLDNGTWSPSVALPALRDGFAVTTTDTGVVLRALAAEITGAKTPEAEQYLQPWRTLLENRRAMVGVDARGQLGTIAFADDPTTARSAAAKDELVQRLLVAVVPVPEEPVGLGARWQVVTVLRQARASVKQTAMYTLAARGKTWTIGVKILRVGKDQLVEDPTLPAGATLNLVAFFRQLEGTLEIDPEHPLVARGSLTVESRIHAKVALPDHPAEEQMLEDTGSVSFAP